MLRYLFTVGIFVRWSFANISCLSTVGTRLVLICWQTMLFCAARMIVVVDWLFGSLCFELAACLLICIDKAVSTCFRNISCKIKAVLVVVKAYCVQCNDSVRSALHFTFGFVLYI